MSDQSKPQGLLRAVDIHKSYGNLKVLKGVSLDVSPSEVVALIGSSGAGKSTLLHVIGTLDEPDSGSIYFENKKISEHSSSRLAHFRNQKLGFVFQFHHLLPEFSALENVCMPAFIAGKSKQESMDYGRDLLDRLGLESRAEHKPAQLSGGEQQRVAIARALINKPQLILADEPTGNLDTINSRQLYELIFNLSEQTGVGFLIVTHDEELAAKCHRSYQIVDGKMGN